VIVYCNSSRVFSSTPLCVAKGQRSSLWTLRHHMFIMPQLFCVAVKPATAYRIIASHQSVVRETARYVRCGGAGNVTMAAGLRTIAKAVGYSPEPNVARQSPTLPASYWSGSRLDMPFAEPISTSLSALLVGPALSFATASTRSIPPTLASSATKPNSPLATCRYGLSTQPVLRCHPCNRECAHVPAGRRNAAASTAECHHLSVAW